MAAMAFRVIIFFPNLVKVYDLFKIWKLGHTHTHTHTYHGSIVDLLLSSGKKEW